MASNPDPTALESPRDNHAAALGAPTKPRAQSVSQQSDDSQTAADFIREQMQLEADAREALPYSIKSCTYPLGRLRQSVFACLTCTPPLLDIKAPFSPAGVCYSCSVQCHGDHELVEIFQKRDFTCDCGTTRFAPTSPCKLRLNAKTGTRGGVHSETPDAGNRYNQNFRNLFCSCALEYNPFKQKGTMFQCLGLGTVESGGCGEDWYHPDCVVGLGLEWYDSPKRAAPASKDGGSVKASEGLNSTLPSISENSEAPSRETAAGENRAVEEGENHDDPPLPPGFPAEDAFDGFICFKCVEAYPWIKRYASAPGFLPPVFERSTILPPAKPTDVDSAPEAQPHEQTKKRRADDEDDDGNLGDETSSPETKRRKADSEPPYMPSDVGKKPQQSAQDTPDKSLCKQDSLPPVPKGRFSLFFKEDFREHLCHCSSCFPLLAPHPQLLEEEEGYEPSISEGSAGGSTHNSGGSLLDRGEAALQNIDRMRAIEGVMAYNHLKDKLRPFFQQYAESGQAISAEDIKAYFARLRGDDQAVMASGNTAA